jgi:hypothetical protein
MITTARPIIGVFIDVPSANAMDAHHAPVAKCTYVQGLFLRSTELTYYVLIVLAIQEIICEFRTNYLRGITSPISHQLPSWGSSLWRTLQTLGFTSMYKDLCKGDPAHSHLAHILILVHH